MGTSSCTTRPQGALGAWASALALLVGSIVPATAAEVRPRYELGVSETYSQDVLRNGNDPIDDYITNLGVTGGLEVRTARSRSDFTYTPTYAAYADLSDLDHLDHRYRGLWSLRPGARSTFSIRQGFSSSSRQVGFTDFDGAGSEAGAPVLVGDISMTRRIGWEIEPVWDLGKTARSSVSVSGLYRSESYNDDRLIDTDQYGLEAVARAGVGRGQSVGGGFRGDQYAYSGGGVDVVEGYDQFMRGYVSWSMAAAERFGFSAEAGVFTGSGGGLDRVTGPTADLIGTWRWRRSALALTYGLGYSSGGGVSTAERSQRSDLSYDLRWGRGFGARFSGTFIRRKPMQEVSSLSLQGRSIQAALEKTWQPGWGLAITVSGLRQQQEDFQDDLSYIEAGMGMVFRPPVRADRPAPPPPTTSNSQ